MITVKSTKNMLRVRNAMGYVYSVNPVKGETNIFFAKHGIELVKHWSKEEETNIYSFIFPSEKDEFLFRLAYSHVL